MSEFKVGDTVKVTQPLYSYTGGKTGEMGYESDKFDRSQDRFVGRVGEVTAFHNVGTSVYPNILRVTFSNGDQWTFFSEQLEKLDV